MTVRDAIKQQMSELSNDPKVVFLGENIINSGRIYGTMNDVPINKCLEMPVAENLIAGVAIGLAIEGFKPVCIFQRMDFMFIAADAIINHACYMPKMAGNFQLPIIFRTVKDTLNDKFYSGLQHTKDLSHVFTPYMRVVQIPEYHGDFNQVYSFNIDEPILIVEDKKTFINEL